MLIRRMRFFLPLIVSLVLALRPHASSAQVTFRNAEIDVTGRLRVTLSNGQMMSPAADSDQVGSEQVALSTDHRTVGWVARFPNCCTSYPIPLKLVLLRTDGSSTVIGNALPIWQWAFAADGRSVVIRQAPVHGPAPTYYERRDMRTGRVIATAQTDTAAPTAVPAWVRDAMPKPAPVPSPAKER